MRLDETEMSEDYIIKKEYSTIIYVEIACGVFFFFILYERVLSEKNCIFIVIWLYIISNLFIAQ